MSSRDHPERPFDADVLVVGGGPVGLALALELGHQGRSCILVEHQSRAGLVPRAKTTNVRTRELLRRWGIADRLAALSPFGVDYPSNVVFATRLNGHTLARFENAMCCSPVRDDRFSEHAQWVPQYHVETVLRERVRQLPGVRVLEHTRLLDFEQDAAGVTARLLDVAGGGELRLRCAFLAGADGARSTVREQLGIRMEGRSPLSSHRNHVFRAPGLAGLHPQGPAIMYWLVNPEIPCVIAPLDQGDLWTFGRALSDDARDPAQLIVRALGFDTPLEVLSTDDWTAHQLVAERYRVGRAFLVGDACHLHPPFGGHGMNMGVGDAVDLGWKLAAVLAGWGGPALLDSYGIERRQVHRRVVDESVQNHGHSSKSLWRPGLEDAGPEADAARAAVGALIREVKQPEFASLSVVIGAHYEDSPVLVRSGADRPAWVPGAQYQASARPGCRAPHAWLAPGRGAGASLYDHVDARGLTVLATREAARTGAEALAELARSRGIPARALVVPDAVGLRAAYQADLALLRPDHYVAWRGDDAADGSAALDTVCGRGMALAG